MRSSDVTTDQLRCGVCDAPATTSPPAKIVSFDGVCGDGGIVQQRAATKDNAANSRVRMLTESYRRIGRSAAVPLMTRMSRLLAVAAMLAASTVLADGRFSAADVPGAGIRQPG